MHHFVYITEEKSTGRYYIGKHSTKNPADGYQGSGYWVTAALAAGRQLETRIVQSFENAAKAFEFEKTLIGDKYLNDPLCMNLCPGGRGAGGTEYLKSEVNRKLASDNLKARWKDPEYRAKMEEFLAKRKISSDQHVAMMDGLKNMSEEKKRETRTKANATYAANMESNTRKKFKPVEAVHDDGRIQTFQSIKQAGEILNIRATDISAQMHGRIRTKLKGWTFHPLAKAS